MSSTNFVMIEYVYYAVTMPLSKPMRLLRQKEGLL